MSEQGPIILGGRYELQRRLARGGMAEVFLAQDQLLGRPVAVKVLFPEFATDPAFVERFRREAQAAANLSHPNIVGVYDWGREGKTYYIVMEYVEGRSLSEVIRTEGPLPAVQAAEIAKEIASALGFAHKNDVVHRDMKSGNVIVSDSGQIKVADFGIATAISGNGQTDLTQTGAVMGTATYFSPEQAQGKPLDGRSDLYSLGIVMYEMLTGTPPFSGDSPVSIAYKHVQEQPELISSRRPGVAEALQAITAKLLNKEPDQRYSRAEELQSDLEKFLSGWHSLGPEGLSEITEATSAIDPMEDAATRVNPVHATQGMTDPNYPGPPYPPQYFDPYERNDRRIWLWGLLTVGLLVALVALIILLVNAIGDSSDSDTDPVQTGTPVPVASDAVVVPFVVDLGRDQAVSLLQARGLEVGRLTTEIRTDIPSDRVLSQDPEPGVEIQPGEAVDLVVSVGPEAKQVPVAVGLTQEEALNRLRNEGFQNIEIYTIKTNDYDVGVVAEQEPEAGSPLEPNNVVVIRVSDGRVSDLIPNNLVGRDRSVIDDQLVGRGWTVIIEEVEIENPDDEVDIILSISPEGGTDHSLEDVVTVQVSVGPSTVEVPSVIGLEDEAAALLLGSRDLFVDPPTDCEVEPGSPSIGRVVSQIPAAGTPVAPESTVSICVGVASEGDPPPATEDTPAPEPEAPPEPEPEATPPPEPEATPTPEPEPTPTPDGG